MAELPVEPPSFLDLDEAFMPTDAAVVLTDSQGLCEAQNTKAAQLLGGALPHGLSLLQLVQPQTSSNKLARLLEEACSQGTPTPRQRIMLTSPDGAQQPCSVIIHGLARQTPGQGSALWLLEPGWESSAILSATFHAIMDASSDILMFASPDLRITHMNKACMDFFTQREVRLAAAMPGFATDKLIGSSIDTFHRNQDHPRRILQDLARRSRHEQGAFHHSHIEIAGFIFKQTIRPVHIAGELMGYSVAWCDLTTERLQENMLETLLDSSEHGMVVIDATGAVLKANAPARALLGDQTDWRTLLGEASSELFRALEQATISSSFETWAKTSANQTVFLRCRVKRLPKHPDEPAARFAMTLTDLTDSKEQESQLQELLAAQQQAIAAISTSLAALAQGDLSHEPPQDLQGELAALADHLGALIVVLRFVVGRIQQAITQIRGGLGDLVSGNKSLDARTQQQAASIQEISTALEELSDAVARNAEHAASTAAKAAAMRHHAAEGSKVIDAAAQNMAAIAQTSEAIVEIIAVVDEIAFTTNILALNAAVEAARAGEHGRGFAVVAAEVRRLAQSSASHAKHIKQLIAKSTSLIQEGSALSTQGAEAFAAILEGIGEVSARIAEIAEVTSSQGQASAQLTEAITAVSRATQENSALVEENSAACASLADQAEQLEKMLTEVFRVG